MSKKTRKKILLFIPIIVLLVAIAIIINKSNFNSNKKFIGNWYDESYVRIGGIDYAKYGLLFTFNDDNSCNLKHWSECDITYDNIADLNPTLNCKYSDYKCTYKVLDDEKIKINVDDELWNDEWNYVFERDYKLKLSKKIVYSDFIKTNLANYCYTLHDNPNNHTIERERRLPQHVKNEICKNVK